MLLRLNYDNPHPKDIQFIIDCLKNDGIIIYPTDTVYSIGCDITKPKAIEKLCRLKNIKPEKANFSFVCSDLSQLANYAKPISNSLFRVMKKALPGPYTFILEANNNVPKLLKQNKKTVGIRVPDNTICKAIIAELGNPIITTSLHNQDDEIMEYFVDPEIIHREYEKKVDIVIDGGFGNLYASTVLDCSEDEIVIVREGLGSLDILD
ncbi:MAG: Sua5/YciO/YrdC/YwlC family protein [Bacteroidetes bacterium]|jgi:tRNA threonylcarbamoyl adenosine modification protein (Sua5/YciO/YrdC/YwlC family)|nr:Sua5/YciO/YrdC/YwlC family protein [Bacteroidota bacterium]